MWTATKLSTGKSINYGLGWGVIAINGERLITHNGGGWGFNTAFYRYPRSGLSVVVLTNLQFESKGTTHADQMANDIAAAHCNVCSSGRLPI